MKTDLPEMSFSIEQAQRACLKKVETGLWEEQLQQYRKRGINEEAMISGKVCRIDEAEEPSEIIWENIDTNVLRRFAFDSALGYRTSWLYVRRVDTSPDVRTPSADTVAQWPRVPRSSGSN